MLRSGIGIEVPGEQAREEEFTQRTVRIGSLQGWVREFFYQTEAEEVDKAHTDSVKTIPMIGAEGRSGKQPTVLTQAGEQQPVLPLLGLHQALEEAGAYDEIKKQKNRDVLKEYLTTEKPMGDLKDTANVKTVDAVYSIVHRNLHKIFEHLPLEIQEEYGGSAEEAIKLKSAKQLETRLSRGRIKKGIDEKRTNSEVYKQNLSAGTSRRWEYYREVDKPQGKPPFSEQGLENIRRARSNSPRENYSKAANRRWELYREQQAQSTPTQEPHQTPPEEHTVFDSAKLSQKH
jgi:hypothetical protein